MNHSNLLHELYHDPERGLQGLNSLYKKAKEIDKTITLKTVQDF